MLQTFLFSLNQVFSKPRYIVLSITAFIVVVTLAIWLPNLNFLGHITVSDTFSPSQKIGIISSVFGSFQRSVTPFSPASSILVSLLFALHFSFFVYFFLR